MRYHLIASLEGIPFSAIRAPYSQHEIARLSVNGLWPLFSAKTEIWRDLEHDRQGSDLPLILPLACADFARECDLLLEASLSPLECKAGQCNFRTAKDTSATPIRLNLIFPTDLLQINDEVTAALPTSWVVAPLALMPTIKAILSILRWDSHLAAHYLKQLAPILEGLTPELCENIWQHKQLCFGAKHTSEAERASPISPLAREYFKLERKLDRQYDAH